MNPLSAYSDAISGIESGGRYGLLGPRTHGDRAYGKYQVMGANIPSWTKQYFGQSLTPQQFLNNPAAQDAVFQGRFGEYAQKYGPEGAARAWFAGEGGMNNPNAKDVLGTSVRGYGQKFMANLQGGAVPDQMANYPGAMTPGTQAPPLPPPIDVASANVATPQDNPSAGLGGAPQTAGSSGGNPFGLLAGLGGGLLQGQQQQAPQTPPLPQNPIVQMAMLQPPPNTKGLQQLLQNSPALRGLLV